MRWEAELAGLIMAKRSKELRLIQQASSVFPVLLFQVHLEQKEI